MFYDKRTQRKIQLLNLLIALLILIPILLDFSKGFMMGLNSSVIGFQNGLEESTFQICTVKPASILRFPEAIIREAGFRIVCLNAR